MAKQQLEGKIISNKMQKTVVVQVETLKEHLKYKRRYKNWKKYKAHIENMEAKIGDKVLIQESRPLSREKRWVVVKILSSKSEI